MQDKGMPPPYTADNSGSSPSAPTYGFVNDFSRQPVSTPVHVIQPPAINQSHTVVVNSPSGPGRGCPVCHNNSWTGTYSCLAWLCCIFCFPCGIICCCCMRKKKCSKCGFIIGG